MLNYAIRRLILVCITLTLITMIVFLMIRMVPGTIVDVLDAELSQLSTTPIDREAIARSLALDLPIHVQYGKWLGNIIRGDFGTILRTVQPVTEEILARIPVALGLGLLALLIGWSVSIPVGIYSAIRQDSIGDCTSQTVAGNG